MENSSVRPHPSAGEGENSPANSLPDFIIGGAMKCGTSSLHYLLDQHDDIFVPPGEVQFFCLDDIVEHPAVFKERDRHWENLDYERNFRQYLPWYERFFEPAGVDQVVGEDSTTYLPAFDAPGRIAEVIPEVKLIFTLRDPVARVYSHYWDRLTAGQIMYRFEEQLRKDPMAILRRSLYRRQVKRYLEHFPSDQIKFVIFEDFISNTQECIDDLCAFVGVDRCLDVSALQTQRNPSWYPRWPGLLVWQNRLARLLRPWTERYKDLPGGPEAGKYSNFLRVAGRSLEHRMRYFNLRPVERPPISRDAKRFLSKLLYKENRGLSDLIDIDLATFWPSMRKENHR